MSVEAFGNGLNLTSMLGNGGLSSTRSGNYLGM